MKISDVISKKYNISKRLAKKYIKERAVKINGKTVKSDDGIFPSCDVTLDIHTEKAQYNLQDYLIAHHENIIFFYKPPFMHTERLRLEDKLTISDIVEEHFPDFNLISRLDYETDGVIPAISKNLNIEFIEKQYLALIHGRFDKQVTLFNKIDAEKRKKVKVSDEQTGAETLIEPIRYFKEFTLVKVTVEEATRHQIRALLSHINHPIAGDKMYGSLDNFDRLMLRCQKVMINDTFCSSKFLKKFIKTCKSFTER
ncbi:hypothetical protein DSN97_10900 [Deferribacteraceae bacterium V6Fe1]|nr:hypothetical protein DSN97_10900 [Deferribacteraceae bacterium V6Fe1]